MNKFRTRLVQRLIHVNEALFFYRKLRKFYKNNLVASAIRVLDVGANKGQTIDFFLDIYPNCIIDAFEPNKKLFVGLQQKYRSNDNISLHNVGVSDIDGKLEFNENILDETSTFEVFNPESKYLEKKARILGVKKEALIVDRYEVDVIRLCAFLQNHNGISYDVLKIDAEGHELQCLKGLFENAAHIPIRLIQYECHNDDMYLNNNRQNEITQLLQQNGFSKIAEIKHGFGDFCELIYENTRLNET